MALDDRGCAARREKLKCHENRLHQLFSFKGPLAVTNTTTQIYNLAWNWVLDHFTTILKLKQTRLTAFLKMLRRSQTGAEMFACWNAYINFDWQSNRQRKTAAINNPAQNVNETLMSLVSSLKFPYWNSFGESSCMRLNSVSELHNGN